MVDGWDVKGLNDIVLLFMYEYLLPTDQPTKPPAFVHLHFLLREEGIYCYVFFCFVFF